ncbi:hypothetical protein GO986_17305 [Deinococcus sp. HMF7620]|uniref:Uncharacterized protein n=1 Tax=Deinococcus arboris TaxID=2682977 RepID=A0A7C9LSV1_9DEIO|nr:hypothetical protein [Deinococcus arboris]MVN88501.1 hypothetical protein [Deinococcus arboris]
MRGRAYDAVHYRAALVQNYATRLRKALDPADSEQLFGTRGAGLFDRLVGEMRVQ